MEQSIVIKTPTGKIYKDKEISLATFLGGPLAAGYLIAQNFEAFDETDKASKTWFFTVLVTVGLFGSLFLIPANTKIPNQLIPLIYTAVVYGLVHHFQGQKISTHIESGGHVHSWGRTIAVGIIGLAITLIMLLGFGLISDSSANVSISTKTYGVMKHEIAFDKTIISETEVDKLADGFIQTTFFDEAVTKYVYAEKVNDRYELSISVIDGIANDSEALQPFIELRADLQSLFPENKIVFKLVLDNLDHVVKKLE